MNKIVTFFAKLNLNPKINNALHLIVGVVIGVLISLFLDLFDLPQEWYYSFFSKGILVWVVMKVLGEKWESIQVKEFGAKHSALDVNLGIVGGLLGVILLCILNTILD